MSKYIFLRIIFLFLLIILPYKFTISSVNVFYKVKTIKLFINAAELDGSTTDSGSSGKFTNPLKGIDSPEAFIGQVLKSLLGLVGSIALVMFIWGGFTWMTSAGNQTKVKEGQEILKWSAIGLIMIFIAYPLVMFILSSLGAKP